jgi:hypothetical protein
MKLQFRARFTSREWFGFYVEVFNGESNVS